MPEDPPVPIAPVPPAKARLAGLVAHRDPADPAITDARVGLKSANLAARIRADVASWPPLSADVRAELALLLLTGDGDAA
jgi:hypothetical protein